MSRIKKKRAVKKKLSMKARRGMGVVHSGPVMKKDEPGLDLEKKADSGAGVFILISSLALIVAGLFGLPNVHVFLNPTGLLARFLTHPSLIWVGLLGLVWGFRSLPEAPEGPNLSRGQAYPWFAFFFALCATTRFYNPGEAAADYWADFMVVARDIRAIIDVHDFNLIFPAASREPFFPYFTAALWELFPKATGVWISRLSSTLIDLCSIWGLYLLGRTLHGRQMGLILMSLFALSMPMTFWCYLQGGNNTTVLACIWALVFFFRLIQKPSMARFIYWGLSLYFGAITYVPFRPWAPIMITAVLIWVLVGTKERLTGSSQWILAFGVWISWIFLFVYRNNFLHSDNVLVSAATKPWFLIAAAVGLSMAYFKTWRTSKEREIDRKVFGWATASFLTAVLSAPMMFNSLYAAHTSESSLFHVGGKMGLITADSLRLLWSQITYCLGMMFSLARFGLDPYPLTYHSYFDTFPELAMIIGLAYLIGRPSWRKLFVFSLVLVGMVPFVLAQIQHAGRVSGTVAPLFLIGAWGLDYFWRLFSREAKNKLFKTTVFLLLFAFWAWDGHWSFKLCRQWMSVKDNDVLIGEQVGRDWKEHHVLIARFGRGDQFATGALTMLCDQTEAYLLNDPNPIYLEPGQKGKDVVVLMYGGDQVLEARLKKEFPSAQWTIIPGMNPAVPRFMERVLIPADSLGEARDKILYIQRVPHDYWRRRFYCQEYGVAHGLMWWDDRVPSLTDPHPPGLTNDMSAKTEGEISIPEEGDYLFSTSQTTNVIILAIDGKTVIDLRPPNGTSLEGRKKIHLGAGIHQASLTVSFRSSFDFPDIRIKKSGSGNEWILGKTLPSGKP